MPAVTGPTWDQEKHARNLVRGRLGFDEAATVLEDPRRVEWQDREHSGGEDRFVTVGISIRGRFALVVTAYDLEGRIRVISARRPTRRERHAYETGIPLE